jgi:esterase
VGTGPIRVIVAHGWIADHSLFDPFIALIDRRRFTFLFPDCRGYGARREEPGPRSIAGMAQDILATADVAGWRRFHIVGHSMGGMAAQRLMIDAPERLASTVLLAPVPATGARLDAARWELLQCAMADPEARRALIDANSGRKQSAAWVDQVLQLSQRTADAKALADYLAAWSGTDFSREVRPATTPVHVIVGDLDPGASRERMAETILRWHPHSTLQEFAGVGHYPMQECPAELWREIERRLSAVTP